uniref:Uncharacterized protein n=1 Tax=Rhizophora mucronata TaxID=61149 RepID=A0A2P2PJV2_RHIMU
MHQQRNLPLRLLDQNRSLRRVWNLKSKFDFLHFKGGWREQKHI